MFKKINAFREDYLKDPYPVMSYVIFNIYSKYSRKIDEIFFLYHDSWGSTRFETFKSEMDLVQVLVRALNGCIATKSDYTSAMNVVSSSPFSSTKDFIRIKTFINDLFSFFLDGNADAKKSYVTMMGNQYLIFYTRKTGASAVIDTILCDSEAKMMFSLSFNYGLKNMIRVDPSIKELNFLKTIIDNSSNEAIQIYFDSDRKYSLFYVIDESGSLFFYRKPADLLFDYLTRLYLFAKNVASQVVRQNPASSLRLRENPVEIFQMKKDLYMNYSVTRIDPEHSVRIEDLQKKIQPCGLAVAMDANREMFYSITLPDGKQSEPFSKHSVVQFVKKLNGVLDSKDYRPFVTAVDLTRLQHKYFRFYSSYSFYEKMRAELMLEGAQAQANK